ncbi:MAG: phenyltransferase domain-containing protein [Desulfobacterales bacterium PC51MH44]|nr:MAG: phenyltransferase domain-containing protein [Desulfobacterales bacterium PC51MH44]
MELNLTSNKQNCYIDIDSVAGLVAKTQKESGEIPWCEGEKTDPWDHVEAAMGLSIGGYLKEARQAFKWMAKMQLDDGSWYASYRDGIPEDTTRDTNMSSYIAVGVFHYYLVTGDLTFLKKMWQTVKSAINFALSLQAPGGEVYWAISPKGEVDTMALLTGSSSVYMSIKCALAIAKQLGYNIPAWEKGLIKLKHAIQHRPGNFNRAKSRYSMDWFYPILSGALTGEKAQQRVEKFWNKFVINGQGVRCVSDRPWVTVAETCEFSLALSAIGNLDLSEIVFSWIQNKTNKDGSYWCGFTCPDMTIWPKDKSTWTNAVVLIAADAIYDLTPASRLFSHRFWDSSELFLYPDWMVS